MYRSSANLARKQPITLDGSHCSLGWTARLQARKRRNNLDGDRFSLASTDRTRRRALFRTHRGRCGFARLAVRKSWVNRIERVSPRRQKMTNITEATLFGAASTTDEVLSGVNLRGKRILVTGVSAGLGVETARSLAAHGAHVVGAARDLNKAKTATARVLAGAAAQGAFDLVELDLANLKSVRACADRLVEKGEPFDVVIANAGVMATPPGQTADGFETQFGTNHLGH